ncbi:MAG: hypothetical protein NVS2B16_28920 [Chloroflexota bacterium]
MGYAVSANIHTHAQWFSMRFFFLALLGLLCTALWLLLLEATSFSNLAVSTGLLGVIFLTAKT